MGFEGCAGDDELVIGERFEPTAKLIGSSDQDCLQCDECRCMGLNGIVKLGVAMVWDWHRGENSGQDQRVWWS